MEMDERPDARNSRIVFYGPSSVLFEHLHHDARVLPWSVSTDEDFASVAILYFTAEVLRLRAAPIETVERPAAQNLSNRLPALSFPPLVSSISSP